MILRWFLSRTVRQAVELRKHVIRMLRAQQDLLPNPAIHSVQTPAHDLDAALKSGESAPLIQERMKALEEAANRWLRPYPHASLRENIEVILVAVAVALAIRSFFLQPMKIPTGSMQPTLYGITTQNLKDKPNLAIPRGLRRVFESAFLGTSYYQVVAQNDGELRNIGPVQKVFPFIKKQRFLVGDTWYTIWFPPASLPNRGVPDDQEIFVHSGIEPGHVFHRGEDIIKLKVVAGDHLFVNRMAYNFCHPQRGDIVIFETRGIEGIQQDTFYIKRLVALGGDRLQIGNDQHLIVNGRRLDAATPPFENIYTFGPEPKENEYFGHVNNFVARKLGRGLGTKFTDGQFAYPVPPNYYFVMGDNTVNSLDSRYWGAFPREKVIGQASFVYWPISSRFGWGYR